MLQSVLLFSSIGDEFKDFLKTFAPSVVQIVRVLLLKDLVIGNEVICWA